MKQFKTSFRALYKFKFYSIVNILGLAVSLACVIIIARYVHQETTVNSFATDLDRTYIMSTEDQNGRKAYLGLSDYNQDLPDKEFVKEDFIEHFSRFIPYETDFIHYDETQYNTKLIVTDSKFLEILPYPILYGKNFTEDPYEVILTRQLAQKVFNNVNPIGEAVTFSNGEVLKVVGIIDEPSSKSGLEFDLLVNIQLQKRWGKMAHNLLMLHANSDLNKINHDLRELIKTDFWNNSKFYQLVPLKELYFDNTRETHQDDDPVLIQGNINNVKILLLVAILMLIVGLFNYINIHTVISIKRGRELAIKKVYGASLWQIAIQVWFENLMSVFAALLSAWFILEVTTTFIENKLAFIVMHNFYFDALLTLVALIILPLILSIFPYIRYIKTAPVKSLNAIDIQFKSTATRKIFLFLQYAISFALLIVSMFFMKQLNFMLNTKPGYQTENTIIVKMLSDNHMHTQLLANDMQIFLKLKENTALINHKLNESPLITSWIVETPIHNLESKTMLRNSKHDEYSETTYMFSSKEYFDFFGFELVEGRLWDATDEFAQYKCIINESAKKLFGISDIKKETLQLETRLFHSVDVDGTVNPPYEVVGVIKDFNIGHLSKSTPPLMFCYSGSRDNQYVVGNPMPIMLKFLPEKKDEVIAYLETIYKEVNDDADFTYALLDDEIAKIYDEDKRVSNIYTLFALLTILISAMGLFALSLFDIQQRYREIALRKINGATAKDIMQLLLKKYLYLLAGAFVIAVPVAYLSINKYLESFAHKAPISWWLFAIAAIVVSAISLLTLMWQIKRAMKVNPANALQSE